MAYSAVVPLLRRRAGEAALTRLGFAGMAVGCGVCGVASSAPVFFLAVAPMVVGAAVVRRLFLGSFFWWAGGAAGALLKRGQPRVGLA